MTHNPIYEFMKRQFPGQMMYFCSGIIILAYFPVFRKYMRYLFPVSLFLLLGREYLLLSIFEPIVSSLYHYHGSLWIQVVTCNSIGWEISRMVFS